MNIKAEHLKLKRTVINKLLWIAPFLTALFAWQVNWIEDVFSDRLSVNCVEWFLIMILTGGILIMVLWWFSQWEGRKNHE